MAIFSTLIPVITTAMYQERRLSHNWLAKRAINVKVKQHLSCLKGCVVDLGCGTRPFEKDILQFASTYIGIDWINTLHGLRADIFADVSRSLPIRDEVVQHVVSFEVMEHLREPEVMLCEAFRILTGGGSIMVSAPFQWWVHEAPWDYYRFTKFGHEYLFSKAGFVDIVVESTTGFWSMWLLKLNYQTARLVRGPKVVRQLIRALLIPGWWLNQTIAPWLDKAWPEEREAAGYFVTARKP